MATIFVSSVDGNNADDGSTWALAKQTVAGALAIAAAGDYIAVDSAHNFTATAAITWTPPAGGVAIESVTRSGTVSVTPQLAGATESVGAANNAFNIAGAANSAMYVYGMTINGGTNNSVNCTIGLISTNTISRLELDTCTIALGSVSQSAQILFGAAAGASQTSNIIRAKNCAFNISASRAGTFANVRKAKVELINPTFSMGGATKPAILFAAISSGDTGSFLIRDADLTGYAVSSGAYFGVANFNTVSVVVENCKLSSTPTLTTGTWPGGEGSITLRNTDTGDTTYVFQYTNSYGTLTAETTDYVTTGGAQFNGAPIAWKIVTTSLATEFNPFILPPLAIWNTTTSSQTSAIEIAQVNGATAFTDRQVWSDLDFAASTSFPNYTFQSNRNAQPFLGTGSNQPTSTNSWTVPNIGANPVLQKLQNTFTAAETGELLAEIKVGIASTTLWINPAIDGVT